MLTTGGLTDGDELVQIHSFETKKVLFNFPSRGKDWAQNFYRVLKSNSRSNRAITCLFETHILDSIYSEVCQGGEALRLIPVD